VSERRRNPVAGRTRVIENSAITHEGTGKMAERLDFEALWPFELGRFGTTKGNAPCFLEVASFLKTGQFDDAIALDDESEALQQLIMEVQDGMPDAERQRLKGFIPRFIGSLDEEREAVRIAYLVRQGMTNWLPMALDASGFDWIASNLRKFEGVESFLLEALCKAEQLPIIEEIVEWAWQT
jgi:hypothetical protein